jgi:hypothetical protein
VSRENYLREHLFYDNFSGMKAKRKNPHAQAMVRARNKKLSPERRSEIARKAVNERWRKARAKAAA